MFEEYNIPITWATVGHLFLDSFKNGHNEWMKKIPHFDNHWLFEKGDWYDFDPCSDYKRAPEWYAPDLLELIMKSKVNHKIGSHSFSHLHFNDNVCPADVAFDDLKACVNSAKQFGVHLKSIVFPGGTNGNSKSLTDNGFTNFRQNSEFDLFYPEVSHYDLIRLPSSFCIGDTGFNWSGKYYKHRFKEFLIELLKPEQFATLGFIRVKSNGLLMKFFWKC